MDKEQIKEILEQHKKWLLHENGKRAVLRGAVLRGAVLQGADLQGADLQGAFLQGAFLQGAVLRGADLQSAFLQGAVLQSAFLQDAILRGAILRGAVLRGADLRGADLRRADLQGANLQSAFLQSAVLRGANLRDGIKIKSKKYAYYQGSDYYCMFFGSIIKIGCEVHYYKDWINFTNKEILAMDGKRALKFGKREKGVILAISKNLQKMRIK